MLVSGIANIVASWLFAGMAINGKNAAALLLAIAFLLVGMRTLRKARK